jgi:hypothetical protein
MLNNMELIAENVKKIPLRVVADVRKTIVDCE